MLFRLKTQKMCFTIYCGRMLKAPPLNPRDYICNGMVMHWTMTTSMPKLLSSVCEWIRDIIFNIDPTNVPNS